MTAHNPRAIARDWLARFAARLDTLPPVLQAEVISTVHTKASLAAMGDGIIRWRSVEGVSPKSGVRIAPDLELCVKRVLSRARVQKFRAIPDDPEVWRQQMAQCAAELGVHSPWSAP